ADVRIEDLRKKMETEHPAAAKVERDIAAINERIRALELEREPLLRERDRLSSQIQELRVTRAEIRDEKKSALEQQLSAQRRWDSIHRINYNEEAWAEKMADGWTPLLWAALAG